MDEVQTSSTSATSTAPSTLLKSFRTLLSLRFLSQGYPWAIWAAISLHALYGYELISHPKVVSLLILVGLNHLSDLGGTLLLGWVLIVACSLATIGLLSEKKLSQRLCFLLVFPQYALMLVALTSDAQVIIGGYHTTATTTTQSVPVDRNIIITALWPVMVIAFFHTLAILERYVARWKL